MGTYFFHRPRGQSIADTLRGEFNMIKFVHPILFTDGSEYDKFIFLCRNRVSANGRIYRISNLSSRDFEVVRGY